MNKIFQRIPELLSSPVSIYIFLFLFFYLVVFPIIGRVIPVVNDFLPTNDAQIVLGNYTNVLSALGASIAAGTSFQAHEKIKDYETKHNVIENKIDDLHAKIDNLNKKSK